MTEVSNGGGPAGPARGGDTPKGGFLKAAILGVLGIGALAILYVIVHAALKPAAGADLSSLARGPMAKLTVSADPKPAPATAFLGPNGQPVHLADFSGQVVVLNVWATWCAPCVVEMPTLARLQARYANQPVKVVALSVDRREDIADAAAFLASHGALPLYSDPKYAVAFSLDPRIPGLPTTIIFDRSGKERARLAGGADWSSPEARAVIDRVLAGP